MDRCKKSVAPGKLRGDPVHSSNLSIVRARSCDAGEILVLRGRQRGEELGGVAASTCLHYYGLPNAAPRLCPAMMAMLPLSGPPPSTQRSPGTALAKSAAGGGGDVVAAAGDAEASCFGDGLSARRRNGTAARDEQRGELRVLFAASGDSIVAGVVLRELGGRQGGEEEVAEEMHPIRFVVPPGNAVDGTRANHIYIL